MFTTIREWLYVKYFNDLTQKQLEIQEDTWLAKLRMQSFEYENKLTEQQKTIQRQEDLLANRNSKAIVSQQIYVTDHALHQYRKRIGFGGSDDELRKMIYKLTLRHLKTMDKLQDGHYKLNDKAAVRIKDNTVCTVVYPTKRQS